VYLATIELLSTKRTPVPIRALVWPSILVRVVGALFAKKYLFSGFQAIRRIAIL
jgi:hypothetical protein